MNIQKMMKQVQQVQKQMQEAQAELSNLEITAEVGAGSVSVTLNGHKELTGIKIKKEAINPDNPESVDEDTVEMLEDLILSAVKEGQKKSEEATKAKMPKIPGVPGMPF